MKKSILLLSCLTLPLLAEKIPVYLGTGSDQGIFLVHLDEETGELSDLKKAAVTSSPGSLAISHDQKYLYAVGREKGEKLGFVASFARMKDNTLRPVNQQSSKGAGPCHISLDSGSNNLFVANYSGGSVTSYSLRNEQKPGTISPSVSHHQHEGSSIHPQRQTKPHAHSIYASPDDKYVYAADLGMDQVLIYKLDTKTGTLTPSGSAKTQAGGGARHMAFSPSGDKLYVLNELTVTLTQFARNTETGALILEKTMPVMAKFEEGMTCSEIQLSADGKFIYAACRDLDEKGRDTIAVLNTTTLEIIQEHPADVWIPRHFGISPSGKWMLVAGQRAGKVIVHKRDPATGKLTKTDLSVDLEKPMWILFPGEMGAKKNIKIMSYNIRYNNSGASKNRHWETRLPIMSTEIIQPSIVGFQEVLPGQLADLKKTMQGFSYVGVGRNDGRAKGEHVPIFYKSEHWQKTAHGHFWLSDTPEKPGSKSWGNGIPRMCTWIRLIDKNGKGIYIYNTHLDHMSSKSRHMSATSILGKIKAREHKDDPVILMGDLNSMPASEPLKILLADKNILLDSYTINEHDPANSTTLNSWKASKKGSLRIDYILTSPNLKVISAEILNIHKEGIVASDHNAIEATIQWGAK